MPSTSYDCKVFLSANVSWIPENYFFSTEKDHGGVQNGDTKGLDGLDLVYLSNTT